MATTAQHNRLKVEGMTCANCAMGVSKHLEKKGFQNVHVNFATDEARFDSEEKIELDAIVASINKLGFEASIPKEGEKENSGLAPIEKRFLFSLLFSIPLLFHMWLPENHWLNIPWVQLALCTPVYLIGAKHFGKSALGSLKTGVPNMDVLIITGTTAAFFYSVYGAFFLETAEQHKYLFFETAATIISLVLLGNVLEHRSVKQTTTAIQELSKIQAEEAKKEMPDGSLITIAIKDIRPNDILQINSGDKVPADGELISGRALVNESMITGESIPVEKQTNAELISGSIVEEGNLRMKALRVGKETVLSQIIEMVKNAQSNRPAIQKLGDKVSGVFVPIVSAIAILTFCFWYFVYGSSLSIAMMNAIAVLVISCPCAMGLATPTAVMVGIGRAAKNGILIKGGSTLEQFAKSKFIVFDKTGTLTTGAFSIADMQLDASMETQLMAAIYEIEKHSSHPIAKSLVKALEGKTESIALKEITENRGIGMSAYDMEGRYYQIGSAALVDEKLHDPAYQLYILVNGVYRGKIAIQDTVKDDSKTVVEQLQQSGIQTVMLSGDQHAACIQTAHLLGIDKNYVHSEQKPDDKLRKIEAYSKEGICTMVGDGINDAPALSKADIGISLSSATQVAIQSAQIILLNKSKLEQLVTAHQISKHTLLTIKQNLFWAFAYNIVAIPIAAAGFLNPMVGALAMAFSDVIVIGNSIRLKYKNIR